MRLLNVEDQSALVKAFQSGQIADAVRDVFETEPGILSDFPNRMKTPVQ
jgi:phosphoglycerate dehydrogenase-like enzyme